jgi:hypothetical protein
MGYVRCVDGQAREGSSGRGEDDEKSHLCCGIRRGEQSWGLFLLLKTTSQLQPFYQSGGKCCEIVLLHLAVCKFWRIVAMMISCDQSGGGATHGWMEESNSC